MTIYNTGTVSVTNGNAVVTGSGTAWAVALISGGIFSSAGLAVPIASVDSDTSLTLAYAWPGTTATGAVYAISMESSEAASVANLNTTLSRILVTLSLAGITPNLSGTIAERNALTLAVGDKGFLFLHAELGYDFEFYRWTGSAWEGPFATRGPAGLGAGGTIEGLVHAATSKTTPVDADEMALVDSAASFGLKKLTWANLKATLKTYLDTLYVSTTLARREVLTGARTFFVRTDGSDSNNGLTNTSGGAFLTVQKAINVVAALDISTFNVTIQVADGTYTGTCIVNGPWVGSGTVTITGNATTPSNVVLQTTASANGVIQCTNGGRITVTNFKVTATGAVGLGLFADTKGSITFGGIEFGACPNYQMDVRGGAKITYIGTGNLAISGGAQYHALVESGSNINIAGPTVTITGTPAFSAAFVGTGRGGGLIEYYGTTFSGSATGKRYDVQALGQIFSNGGGASFYPGSVAGTTNSLGVYS